MREAHEGDNENNSQDDQAKAKVETDIVKGAGTEGFATSDTLVPMGRISVKGIDHDYFMVTHGFTSFQPG